MTTAIDVVLEESFRGEPPCPYCRMPVQEWNRGTCGDPHCLEERAREDEGNMRYEERRDEEI